MINDLLKSHLLVAGTTGAGKSNLEKLLLSGTLTGDQITDNYLIDPKKVELYQYRRYYRVSGYADNPVSINQLLQKLVKTMYNKYEYMRARGLSVINQPHIYIWVDEYADLIFSDFRKPIEKSIIKIAQLGRAAGMHLIICTQRPTAEVVNPAIKCNIDTRIALRTATAQESRNIIGVSGAELLPRAGKAFVISPEIYPPDLIDIPKF